MDMDHAAAVDLLGDNRHNQSTGKCPEIGIGLRSRVFWLLLLVALITATFVSLIYFLKSFLMQPGDKSGLPIIDSALNEQLHALRLNSPWHDDGVGASRVCNTSECVHAAYHLLFGINQAANPCDDFYEYACGNWVKLYKDQGLTYHSNAQDMRFSEDALVKEILMRPPDSYDFQPVKDAATFFHQCASEDNVDSVVNLTTKLGGWPSLEGENWNEDGFDLVTALAFINCHYLLTILVGTDLAPYGVNETVYVLQISVPAFPPEDILKNETTMTAFKSLYKKILREITGFTDSSGQREQDAHDIIELEKALSQAVTVPDEHANASNTQGILLTVGEFQEYLDDSLNWLNKPVSNYSFSWKRLLNEIFSTAGVQINDDQLLIVADLGYLSRMAQILDATPKRTIANYVMWSLALGLLPEASRKMELVIEDFSLQIGLPVDLQPRESNCFDKTVPFFGVALMHEYLKSKSNLEARTVVDQMTKNLQVKFDELLQSNNWLSDATKLTALEKIRALKTFIGYPDWLLNATEVESRFAGLHLGSNFIETFGNVVKWSNAKTLRRLGQSPLGLEEPWFAAHQLVVSFSVSNQYAFILPSAVESYILGSHNYLDYVNYGRIGAAIGHEIIHGFDVTRKNLDEKGQISDQPWSDEDEQKYKEKSNCYRDQYNKFEILPGMYVNGSGGLDENMADNNGLKLAYLTYKEQYARAGNDHQSLPGFEKLSAEQLFFLSYGSLWCEYGNDAVRKYLLEVDAHSPGQYRINGVLQNSPEFADAWNCSSGLPMNPIKKCELW